MPSSIDLETIILKVWVRMLSEPGGVGNVSVSLADYIRKAVTSRPPLMLVKALMCIALGLQQLPSAFIRGRLTLPVPANELRDHYLNTVDQSILSDYEHAGMLAGLE